MSSELQLYVSLIAQLLALNISVTTASSERKAQQFFRKHSLNLPDQPNTGKANSNCETKRATMWSLLGMYVALCAVVFSLVVIITTAVRNRRAQQFFMKLSPNLPVVPNAGIFGGHMNQIWLAKRNWKILGELHKKYGKTIGSFYRDKPFVSTIDLNLIKAMVLDNPNDHVDRMRANTPVLEIEQDCVFTTDEEQWRRLRRSIAPAFT